MKNNHRLSHVSILGLFGFCCVVHSAPKKVFILAGQSNMRGLGQASELGGLGPYTFQNISMVGAIDNQAQLFTKNPLAPENPGDATTFGPEIGIAQALSKRFPNDQMILIKAA